MNKKRNRYRSKYKKKASRKRQNAQERQMQLLKNIIIMVLVLCLVAFGIMIIKGIGGKDSTSETKSLDSEIAVANVTGEPGALAPPDETQAATLTSVPVEEIKIKISAVGDCTLGSDDNFNKDTSFDTMYTNVGGPSYFFRNVRTIFEEDDLTIVNLEGPLTTSEEKKEKQFAFRGKPEYADFLKEGSVEAANLANNHSYDYGQQGFEDTLINLGNAGVVPFGYDTTVIKEINGAKVGLVGIYVLADGMERASQLKEKIAEVKEQGAQLIIVSFHWGEEKAEYPNRVQRDLGHMAIDEGADLVIGHHPHVLQGIEKYKGKNIVYSLGNFCFGGNSNPSDKDTMIFQQTFTIQGDTVVQDDDVNIIPCLISSESGYNNYQPTPAEGGEKTRIENKINKLSAGIGEE